MSARDDYRELAAVSAQLLPGNEMTAALDEIDRLRARLMQAAEDHCGCLSLYAHEITR